MYTAGDLTEDYTSGNVYAREILDPQGNVICYTIETYLGVDTPSESTLALLSHLNR